MVYVATETGLQDITYPYVGAWRGQVAGQTVPQPLTLAEQEQLMSWLNTTYWQPYYDEYDLKAAQSGKTTGGSGNILLDFLHAMPQWYLDLVSFGVPGMTFTKEGITSDAPMILGAIPGAETVAGAPGATGGGLFDFNWPDIDLSGLGSGLQQAGTMALVGLGLVAVIMFLK
jgi:hypothetical protein